MIDPAAHARLERWKRSLLDRSTAQGLLDLGAGAMTIPLSSVDPVRIAAALGEGAAFALAPAADEAPLAVGLELAGTLRSPLANAELARRVVVMRREARTQLVDRGAHVLWLALGALIWRDAGEVEHRAPIALWPVALERTEQGATLLVGAPQAEPQPGELQRALCDHLERALGLAWPLADGSPDGNADAGPAATSVAALLDAAEGIAASRPGWRVERSAALGMFSTAELVMCRDLEARAAALLAGPIAAHLASGAAAFDPPSQDAAAALAAPRAAQLAELIAPLDADAGQLAVVAGAAAGASFVVDGPPGTGKSQTIANLVAHCIASGKTVLVVSAKLAALEAVQQRLASVGLGEFCIALYGPAAVPARVAAQLGRVVERAFRPAAGPSGGEPRLAELCAVLDDHVAALHRVGPFGQSLHDVVGRLVELRQAPRAALAECDASGLDGAAFERRKAAACALAAAAQRVEPVAGHAWRASTMERWPQGGEPRARAALDAAGTTAVALERAVQVVARLVPGLIARTREQLLALGALGALVAKSPRPGAELLTQHRFGAGDDAAERIALIRARGGGALKRRTREDQEERGARKALERRSREDQDERGERVALERRSREDQDERGERVALERRSREDQDERGERVALDPPRDPGAFLVLARRHRQLATEVNDRFTDSVAELDPHALWVQLRRWTHRVAPLRFVALRDSRAAIRAAAMPGMLETDGAMITALEAVIAERAVRAALLAAAEPARRWFGELGGDPLALDLGRIDAAVTWAAELRLAFDAVEIGRGDAGRAAAWRALVAQVAANPAGDSPASGELGAFSRLAEEVARWTSALAELAEATGIAAPELGAGSDHLSALGAQIESLRGALDGMRDWVAFHAARQAALAEGVGPAVAAVERGELPAAELAQAWERATLLSWADAEIAATPALAEFHGATHHAQVAAFADLDRATLALLRSRALVRLAERVPRATIRPATRSGTSLGADPGGELGALVQEIRAQHGHRPLRQLFSELPTLLPSIAPCLLMPPLAVAQHLDPARPRFDVVVFDEASQLPTAEAIGALARGNTAVIVGDRAVADPDSLLADAIAAGLPTWRLECHYRSRHEDLIAFACQRTHGDRLQVFPAAGGAPDLGVSWRHVEGIDLRAGARCNRIEAEAVVAEVLARLRDPAQRTRSIAIVALSREQRELIEDLLDDARASAPELDRFFEPEPERGECAAQVIVETIEAIRGDQRDVAIVSVGAIAIDLGVLSQHGGERWLSIATTRAREQLIVFSSVAPEDLAHAVGQGAQDLAALLAFARAGGGAARAVGGAEPASPIAAAIAHALVERGWTVHHQVGCSAYKIDLAVVDPGDAARYVLAIETDGAAYASAAAARDRDRLRAQMLGQLGWRVHRIWALDWWTDPEREVQRAHTAIVTAVAASRQRRAPARTGAAPLRSARIAPGAATAATAAGAAPAVIRASRNGRAEQAAARDRSAPVASASSGRRTGGASAVASGSGPTDAVTALLGDTSGRVAAGSAPVRIAKNTIAIGPYLAAAIPAGRRAPDDLFAPRHHGELGKIIDQVLAAEAPMHIDVLARRVGAYFGFGRPTPRVIERVSSALEGRGRWGDEDGVVWRLDQDPAGVPPVRVAGQVASARRDIAEVPLAEVAAAARIVVERAAGIAAGDLVRDAARLLGFARLTDPVVQRVASGVRLAAQRDLIRIDGGKAMLPD